MSKRSFPPRLLWLLLLPALVALSCNYPLAASVPFNQNPPPDLWNTPTPPPFLLLTPDTGDPQPIDPPPQATTAPSAIPTLPTSEPGSPPPILYYTQAGDTLQVLSVRFAVSPDEITSPSPIPAEGFINPEQLLIIPDRLGETSGGERLLPDSEFVYSPSAVEFDTRQFIHEAGGYLATYEEYLGSTGDTPGADIIQRVAIENSINPRLLLALLDYLSGWVSGQPGNLIQSEYPMGLIDNDRKGLYRQLAWAINQLSVGYYGWREGHVTDIRFSDGSSARLAPDLNAGTVALQYFFAQLYDRDGWQQALDPQAGFLAFYERMFGNPWIRARGVEPLFPPDMEQPALTLPFARGQLWSYTGGPHGAWERDGARAALDFAPGSEEPGCVRSYNLVLAAASGLVTRAENGVIMLDLDGDGREQTGWGLLYLHISSNGNTSPVSVGSWVNAGDFLGYPSCEGGAATGTHIHIARKYNGEWLPADGPIPFNLGGWVAHAGLKPYEGTLTRDGVTITASPLGTFQTRIMRGENDP